MQFHLLLPILFFFASTQMDGQALVHMLAKEVCHCLSAEELVYPKLQADRCLTTVMDAYPRQIKAELQLSVRKDDDRKVLEAMLIDPLTADCQVLQDLHPPPPERELHYSDFPLAKIAAKPIGKQPLPDPSAQIVSSEPEIQYLRAKILTFGNLELEVSGPNGQVYRILISDRKLLRQLELEIGRTYTLKYAFDWRSSDTTVLRELLGVL